MNQNLYCNQWFKGVEDYRCVLFFLVSQKEQEVVSPSPSKRRILHWAVKLIHVWKTNKQTEKSLAFADTVVLALKNIINLNSEW